MKRAVLHFKLYTKTMIKVMVWISAWLMLLVYAIRL